MQTVRMGMFDDLSNSLGKAWDIVKKDGKLTADNIKAPMREIRRALLEADVSLHHIQNSPIYCVKTALARDLVPPSPP